MGIIAFLTLFFFNFWNYFHFSQLCALIVTMCRRLAAWAMAFLFHDRTMIFAVMFAKMILSCSHLISFLCYFCSFSHLYFNQKREQ